jgi:hypothetical protein
MTKYTIFKKNVFDRCNQFEKEYKKQQKQKPVSRPLTPFAGARRERRGKFKYQKD